MARAARDVRIAVPDSETDVTCGCKEARMNDLSGLQYVIKKSLFC